MPESQQDTFFKTILTEFSNDNVKVFMVDGSTIRDPLTVPFWMDFTEGDNDAHNPDLVPPGEAWIDLDVAPTEVRCTILHELTERRYMINDGLDYDDAHDKANEAEEYARAHRDQLNKLCMAELKLAPAYKSKSMPQVEVKNMPRKEPIKKLFTVTAKEVAGLERTLDFTASLETPDRMGDQVKADTWKLDNYRKNPVFMWCHNYTLPPIGKSLKEWVENGKLIMRIQFADDTIDYPDGMPSADTVYKLYQGGFMNAVSVGFDPSTGDAKSISGGGTDYTGQELLELSAVPVPAHPDALRRAEEAGVLTVKQLTALLPKKKEYTQGEISDEIAYLKTMIAAAGLSPENMAEMRRLTGGDMPDEHKDLVKCTCEGCKETDCKCKGADCTDKDCQCKCHSNKILQIFQTK